MLQKSSRPHPVIPPKNERDLPEIWAEPLTGTRSAKKSWLWDESIGKNLVMTKYLLLRTHSFSWAKIAYRQNLSSFRNTYLR